MRLLKFNEMQEQFDFYKTTYIAEEKAVIGAYYIREEYERSLIVLNIQENLFEDRIMGDGSKVYWISPHMVRLPISQIEILSDVPNKENFKYIKIPYWLFKKNSGLEIKRIEGKKMVSFTRGQINKSFVDKIDDTEVRKYFDITSSSEQESKTLDSISKRIKNHLDYEN